VPRLEPFVRKNYLFGVVMTMSVLTAPVVLQGCVAPALLLSPQSQLMWALLKPMVGLDPKEVNLFKQELIRSRLQPLLGQHYGTAVALLETADQIQQEGPLFYVASRYTPLPDVAEKAGFVWNSETNQMAVLLVSGGAPQIFAEKLNEQVAQQVPAWPKELADYTDPDKLKQKALAQASAQADAILPDEVKQLKTQAEQVKTQVENVKAQVEQVRAIPEQTQQQVTEQLRQTSTVQQATQQINQLKDLQQTTTDAQAAVNASDEMLAELAAEQQETTQAAQRAQLKQQLQQQLTAIDQQLALSKDAVQIQTLQQQRQLLQQQLDQLHNN